MPRQSLKSAYIKQSRMLSQRMYGEQGSALVLVMFLVLLLTILGLAVLSAAVGGAQRTETRKNDVQSLHLAEKSLDEGVAYITANLNKVVEGSVDMSQEQLQNAIKAYLQKLNENGNGLPTTTELTQAGSSVKADFTAEKPNQYQVTLTSDAQVNGVQRKLKQILYIDTFPDFLNYTLGSEGDLMINGSPWISGNIYSGGTLKLDKKVQYMYQGISKDFTSQSFQLVDGEAHVQSLEQLSYNYWDRPKTAAEIAGTTFQTELGVIAQKQVKIRSRRTFVQVNVKESFIDKVSEAMSVKDGSNRISIRDALKNGTLAYYLRTSDLLKLTENELIPPVLTDKTPGAQKTYDAALVKYKAIIAELTQGKLQKSVIYSGNLTINDGDLSQIIYEKKEEDDNRYWFIVDGDLNIESFNASKPAQIKANMLVTGKVTIRGNAEFDSAMYVLKAGTNASDYTTTVEDAEINGFNGSQLVLMSQGPILFNRLKAFDETVTPIKAFFYTDSSAELYGVGSIFSLKGGFFAKGDLTINAVRGDAVAGNGQINIVSGTDNVRFKAEYDNTVFTAQNAGLPRVKAIHIEVGDLELQ
ncbi:MAG: hypothetical protein K6T94_03150 [Paenibacillus sp.]|nr:hypothetical protein [Paenibacillus sp.]